MRSRRRMLPLLLLILLLAEFYAFTGIWIAVYGLSPVLKWLFTVIYIVITIGFWLTIMAIPVIRQQKWAPAKQNFVLLFFTGCLICKIVVAAFILSDDIRRGIMILVLWATRQDMPSDVPHSVWLARGAFLLGLLLWGGLFWGTKNRYRYQVRRLKLRFDHLPDSFRGLRIIHISDIHSGSFQDKNAVAKGVDTILALRPDLILFTGDLVNNIAEEIVPYKSVFSKLKAPMGVYSILGNHDYGDYVAWPSEDLKQQNLEALKQHHADMGWQLLMNEHRVLEKGNERIALIGIENWGAKASFTKYGQMAAAYKGLSPEHPGFKILMSHDPSHWEAEVIPRYPDIDLTLSGHTHGMQFGVRLGGRWQWSPVQYLYRQWAGLYKRGRQQLYVNVGFGFLGYPGRLGIRPEITLIELL
ncbi:MAG TPA: metallophosphoesterase [Edaphocola sp.]|nr:metallophosphoesterase [Edaphocola sp.]